MLRISSLFSQILAEIPRRDFEKLVANQWDRTKRKGLQVLDPVRGHALLSSGKGLTSLREICHGLWCCNGKLVHLGVLKSPNKSTLSYAK